MIISEINFIWGLLMCRPSWTSQRSEGQWCDKRHLQTHLEVSREWWRGEDQKLLHWEEDSGGQSLDQGGESKPTRQGVTCCHTFSKSNPNCLFQVNPTCAAQSLVVPDLIEGQEYLFRIRAENRFGSGPFVETIQRTKARDPIRKSDLFFSAYTDNITTMNDVKLYSQWC